MSKPTFDTPQPVIEEIFGSSVDGHGVSVAGDATEAPVIRAHLEDHGHSLLLTLTCNASGVILRKIVVDSAEADREIAHLLAEGPERSVVRDGDGWVTHSE